ncbi:MAG: hypothetical protein COX48_05985 [bacterium (Candidatus Stahlbacteria) CG23_combo_of_CG06-09_8_20_14_all_34_7]|nr:MAG: hypothetical protein COX48_05985 [bacterium (Candidatus Stahlbacteria) CG23_combo_of_CG06-09_8_20_14_all_34_7]
MIKLLRDYFIKRRLSSLSSFNKTLNIQKTLENPKKIIILYNEQLTGITDLFSVKKTIENHYIESSVEFVFFTYHLLFRDIYKFKHYCVKVPSPSKFTELDNIKKITTGSEGIDILFDMTSFDIRLRKIIVRTLNPKLAISLYEEGAEDDFNILFKNSKPNLFSIFRSLNFTIELSELKENIFDVTKGIKLEDFDIILIGSSRKVKNEMKRALKEQKRFLLLENMSKQLDIFSLMAIKKCKNIIYDYNLKENLDFIKNVNL